MFLLFLGSCKFVDTPYSFEREFDGGTYITPEGIVKYISGYPDSAITVSDNYAIIKEEISYHKSGAQQGDGTIMHLDSILIYGHCFSLEPNPLAIEGNEINSIDDLKENSVIRYNGATQPERFISITDLGKGTTFVNTLSLLWEKDYYIRSFVVTGRFINGEPEYDDIAYNQYELKIHTKTPVDTWVGDDMQDAPADFTNDEYRGGTSFTYNGYMFVAQGHSEDVLDDKIVIHRYDPISNSWEPNCSPAHPISGEGFTDAVAFVIEDAPIGNNNFRDCVYIGTGIKQDGTTSKEFYRLDLEQGEWLNITSGTGAQPFQGSGRYNAVAFSINGIGYVGLGTVQVGSALDDFYKFDPDDRNPVEHAFGKWTPITKFEGGTRTKAVSFKLGDNVYISCGENNDGVYKNDLRMCIQTTGDDLDWYKRADFIGTARIEAVGFNIGEMGYVGTGWDGDSAKYDFYRYNPFLNEWDKRANYGGAARFGAVGEGIKISDNDYRGYIGTGWDSTEYYCDFWLYRP